MSIGNSSREEIPRTRVKVVVYYFAEARSTIHGTPLVPVQLEVSPSLDVGSLKYMVCYAADLIEDMMALMTPTEPTPGETDYFVRNWSSHSWQETVGGEAGLIDLFSSRRLSENLQVSELESLDLALSIDLNWLKRCPVCGRRNRISATRRVRGFDNIPDLDGDYACTNLMCAERKVQKRYDIRIASWQSSTGASRIPLITKILNGASCQVMYGSKTRPPGPCSLGSGAENPELSKSEYCRCRATNPTDARYCWNCGKKNKSVQAKPPMRLPYDLDGLRRRVMFDEERAQSETIRRSVEFVRGLIRRRAIVEITFCRSCGAQNEITARRCQVCGRELST